MISIDHALTDEKLLGVALGDADTWSTWFALLKAAFGLPLEPEDRRTFAKVAGGRKPPEQRVSELWAVCGRRSGKSRIAAAIAVYIATFLDHRGRLAPGETGFVLCL